MGRRVAVNMYIVFSKIRDQVQLNKRHTVCSIECGTVYIRCKMEAVYTVGSSGSVRVSYVIVVVVIRSGGETTY